MSKPDEKPEGREVRLAVRAPEVRMDDDAGTVTVEGYAAVFDQEADIGGWFREKFQRGAFTETLSEGADVPFLINHSGLPLARTTSGTLKLSEDRKGLKMSAELDTDDPDVQRIVPKMKRGDLDKMSIAFRAVEQKWTEVDDELSIRTIIKADLFDVSTVTTPAYAGTEIGLRSDAEAGIKALEEFKAGQTGDEASANRVAKKRMEADLRARQL